MKHASIHRTLAPRSPFASTAVLAALAVGCREEMPYVKPRTPVRVEEVVAHRPSGGFRYSADVRPLQQVDLAFRIGGYVEEVMRVSGVPGREGLYQEGDPVQKGAVLARLRERDYVQKVEQARGKLDETVAAAGDARREMERASGLFESTSLTQAQLDGVKAKLDAANARVVQAKAAVEEAQIALEDCSLRSPVDGILLRRKLEPGSLAAPGAVVFSVADVSSVKVVFGVPDLLVQSLRLGQTLAVAAEALRGDRFEGRITRVSPWADARSRVFEVEVTVPNPEGKLKVGMIAYLRIPEPSEGPPETVVSLGSIVRQPGASSGYGVFVVEEKDGAQRARLRPVELGTVRGNKVAVVKGVSAGERVIIAGCTLVTDGQDVRVVP